MTTDGDPPSKPKESAQGTLLGFPPQQADPAPRTKAPTKHPLPPPRAAPGSTRPSAPMRTPNPDAPAAPAPVRDPHTAPTGPVSGSHAQAIPMAASGPATIPTSAPPSGPHSAPPTSAAPGGSHGGPAQPSRTASATAQPIAPTSTPPSRTSSASAAQPARPHSPSSPPPMAAARPNSPSSPPPMGAAHPNSPPPAGPAPFGWLDRKGDAPAPRAASTTQPPPASSPSAVPPAPTTAPGPAVAPPRLSGLETTTPAPPVRTETTSAFAGAAPPVPAPPSPLEPGLHASGPIGSSIPLGSSVPDESEWALAAVQKVPGKFVSFLKISVKRAFRLRIEPDEVLPEEREELEAAYPPIVDRNLQAFLAWRRSVLFFVAVALVPLTIIGFLDSLLAGQATIVRVFKMAPVLAEGAFCALCWLMLKQWPSWRKQRRWLLRGWLLFLATPFVVFLIPLRSIVLHGSIDDARSLDLYGLGRDMMAFKIVMISMLQLAPKAISLMPGLVRSSLVIKLLFPGSPAPGWLIVVAAPLYALLAYVILIVPYQFTGSGWFIAGVLGVIAGQVILARAGFGLTRPMRHAEAVETIAKVRKVYISVMIGSAVLVIIALGSLVAQLHLHAFDVIMSILKFETNVLILTMIGADLVITNLDRARRVTVGHDHVEDEAEAKIAAFVSLDSPHVPPPTGPAPGDW